LVDAPPAAYASVTTFIGYLRYLVAARETALIYLRFKRLP